MESGVAPFFLPFCGSADAKTARRAAPGRAGVKGRPWWATVRDGTSTRAADRLIGETGRRGLCGRACSAVADPSITMRR